MIRSAPPTFGPVWAGPGVVRGRRGPGTGLRKSGSAQRDPGPGASTHRPRLAQCEPGATKSTPPRTVRPQRDRIHLRSIPASPPRTMRARVTSPKRHPRECAGGQRTRDSPRGAPEGNARPLTGGAPRRPRRAGGRARAWSGRRTRRNRPGGGVRLPFTGVGATGGGVALGGECRRTSPPRLTTTCAGPSSTGV